MTAFMTACIGAGIVGAALKFLTDAARLKRLRAAIQILSSLFLLFSLFRAGSAVRFSEIEKPKLDTAPNFDAVTEETLETILTLAEEKASAAIADALEQRCRARPQRCTVEFSRETYLPTKISVTYPHGSIVSGYAIKSYIGDTYGIEPEVKFIE